VSPLFGVSLVLQQLLWFVTVTLWTNNYVPFYHDNRVKERTAFYTSKSILPKHNTFNLIYICRSSFFVLFLLAIVLYGLLWLPLRYFQTFFRSLSLCFLRICTLCNNYALRNNRNVQEESNISIATELIKHRYRVNKTWNYIPVKHGSWRHWV